MKRWLVLLACLLLVLTGALTKSAVAQMSEADQSMEQQKKILRVVFAVPGPGWIAGFFYSWYKAGEMDYAEKYIAAVKNNQPKPEGNETSRGLAYAFFKGFSTAPEGIAFYGLGKTTFLLEYDQLDPYSVWTAYGRHYALDALVIGTKAAFGVMAAETGALPLLEGESEVGNSFLWLAAGGGGLNVAAGTASQAFQKARPFSRYYDMHKWWSGHKTLR